MEERKLPQWVKIIHGESQTVPYKEVDIPHKPTSEAWLERLVLKRLLEIRSSPKSGIIRFPDVFEKICRNFSISKKEAWELLFILKMGGVIEIVANQGIRILHANALRSAFSKAPELA